MHSKHLLSLCVIGWVLAACQDITSPTLVQWSGGKLTEHDLEVLQTVNPGVAERLKSEPGRSRAIEDLLNRELLYQAAKSRGLDRKPALKHKKEWISKSLVIQTLLEEEAGGRARKYFDGNPEEFKDLPFEQVKDQLMMKFRREANQELTQQLRAKANIQFTSKGTPPAPTSGVAPAPPSPQEEPAPKAQTEPQPEAQTETPKN